MCLLPWLKPSKSQQSCSSASLVITRTQLTAALSTTTRIDVHKELIPILVEKDYVSTGWLGIAESKEDRLYYDFREKHLFSSSMASLIKEISGVEVTVSAPLPRGHRILTLNLPKCK